MARSAKGRPRWLNGAGVPHIGMLRLTLSGNFSASDIVMILNEHVSRRDSRQVVMLALEDCLRCAADLPHDFPGTQARNEARFASCFRIQIFHHLRPRPSNFNR